MDGQLAGLIRDHRHQTGLTQTQLAELLGVSQTTISWWESGRVEPSVARIRQLIDHLNIDPDDISRLLTGAR